MNYTFKLIKMKDLREKPTKAELRKERIKALIILPSMLIIAILTYYWMIP